MDWPEAFAIVGGGWAAAFALRFFVNAMTRDLADERRAVGSVRCSKCGYVGRLEKN